MDILVQYLWSFPSLLFIFGVAAYVTLQLKFVQFRYAKESVRLLLYSENNLDQVEELGRLSAFQAFINTLGANIGNGSLAGMAVAVHVGGPGSIIWLMILATLAVSLRYAEAFLGAYMVGKYTVNGITGGPMVYMSRLPGGIFWAYLFALFAMGFAFSAGGIAQSHAVGSAIYKSFHVDPFVTGLFVLAFVAYIVLGGAQRIVYVLDKLVPFKVFAFLVTALTVLIYHVQAIPHAVYLMFKFACQPQALLGGGMGFALQQTMSVGFQQGIFASEAGLGTAAIAFGSSKAKSPVKSSILAMLGVYINVHVICFMVALSIIASGVWNNGETSSALLISAYETVFGKFAGVIISGLVINFAMSVLIAAAYNGQKCWDFIFQNRCSQLFPVIYSVVAFCGTWMNVNLVWNINNVVNALLMFINILGLLWFIKVIKKELLQYSATDS